jgi:hypothetical protein
MADFLRELLSAGKPKVNPSFPANYLITLSNCWGFFLDFVFATNCNQSHSLLPQFVEYQDF